MFELVLFGSHPATVSHCVDPKSWCLLQGAGRIPHSQSTACDPRHTWTVVDLLDETTSALVFCLSVRLEQTQQWPPHAFYPCPQRYMAVLSMFSISPSSTNNAQMEKQHNSSPSAASWNLSLAKQWTWDATRLDLVQTGALALTGGSLQ